MTETTRLTTTIALLGALAACSSATESGNAATRAANNEVQGGPGGPAAPGGPQPSSNVSFGGAQDIGFFRGELEAGNVPPVASLDAAGFFAEHHVSLPPGDCGARVCLQPMVAVMGNLMNGNNCTMLHLGLNSPIAADPGQRPPLSLAVVVDVSGSMAGEKIELVRQGLELLIDGMRDEDQLALISYSDQAQVVAGMTPVGLERAALRRLSRGLFAGGATNLGAGLVTGYEQIQAHYDGARQNRVILLSDGVPTAGIVDTESLLTISAGFNSDGIGLTTVGLGHDFNIELMRGLSQQADGNFYFLEDAGAISEVFEEELSFFVVPVALDLELSLSAGVAYDFGRALGSPLWQDTAGGGALEIPSVFVAHRESHDDVTEDDGRRGGGSSLLVELMPRPAAAHEPGVTIATVDVSFRVPGSDAPQSDRIELRYPHRPDELLARGFFEAGDPAAAQKSFVMLNVFVGMESAVLAFHMGRADRATIGELDSLIAAVRDYNEEVGDRDIELDLELLSMLRENLIAAGVPSGDRSVPEDPWPAD